MTTLASLFEEISDSDSIATESTAVSDSRSYYEVEKVLAEATGDDDETPWFLIKWERYPLSDSTWEPSENLSDEIIADWRAQQVLIAQGNAPAFNVKDFEQAQKRAVEAKQERQERRAAKRARRDRAVRKAGPSSIPSQRSKRRKLSHDDASGEDGEDRDAASGGSDDDDMRSLFSDSGDEGGPTTGMQPARTARSNAYNAKSTAALPPQPLPKPKPKPGSKAVTPRQPQRTSHPKRDEQSDVSSIHIPTANMTQSAQSSTVPARNQALAKVPSRPFFANATKQPARRARRQPESDSMFRNLSQRSRVQKYSNDERPPDLAALAIVDPKTGRVQATKISDDKINHRVHAGKSHSSSLTGTESLETQSGPGLSPDASVARADELVEDIDKEPIESINSPTAQLTEPDEQRHAFTIPSRASSLVSDTSIPVRADPFRPADKIFVPLGKTLCRYGEACYKGDRCEFCHPPDSHVLSKSSAKPPWTPTVRCSYFPNCNKGRECRFLHTQEPPSSWQMQSPAEKSRMTRPILEDLFTSTMVDPVLPIRIRFAYSAHSGTPHLQLEGELPVSSALREVLTNAGPRIVTGCKTIVAANEFRDDFPAFTTYPRWSGGLLELTKSSQSAAELLCRLVDHNELGFVVHHENFSMLIFRADQAIWSFAGAAKTSATTPSLAYRTGPPIDLERLRSRSILTLSRSLSTLLAEGISGLSPERLFPSTSGRPHSARAACLFWDSTDASFKDRLAMFLGAIGVTVYQSDYQDARAQLKRSSAQQWAIILHPSVPPCGVSGLTELMQEYGGKVGVFSIAPDRTTSVSTELSKGIYRCERLFPRSSITLITDHVLVYHPQLASRVITSVSDKATKGGKGNILGDRIVLRPGSKSFLYDLVIQKRQELGDGENPWERLWADVQRLCPMAAEDPWASEAGTPDRDSLLISETVSSFHNTPWLGLWDRDRRASTDYLVEWFAGWTAVYKYFDHRFFFICHQEENPTMVVNAKGVSEHRFEVDPHGWSKKWSHLRVMTADEYGHRKKG